MQDHDLERCDFLYVHEDIVQAVQKKMPKEELLYDLSELYKVFGDSTRIKILYVLFEAEMCVCDIAQLLNMSQSAISPSAKGIEAVQAGKIPAGRKNGVLFSGG